MRWVLAWWGVQKEICRFKRNLMRDWWYPPERKYWKREESRFESGETRLALVSFFLLLTTTYSLAYDFAYFSWQNTPIKWQKIPLSVWWDLTCNVRVCICDWIWTSGKQKHTHGCCWSTGGGGGGVCNRSKSPQHSKRSTLRRFFSSIRMHFIWLAYTHPISPFRNISSMIPISSSDWRR